MNTPIYELTGHSGRTRLASVGGSRFTPEEWAAKARADEVARLGILEEENWDRACVAAKAGDFKRMVKYFNRLNDNRNDLIRMGATSCPR